MLVLIYKNNLDHLLNLTITTNQIFALFDYSASSPRHRGGPHRGGVALSLRFLSAKLRLSTLPAKCFSLPRRRKTLNLGGGSPRGGGSGGSGRSGNRYAFTL